MGSGLLTIPLPGEALVEIRNSITCCLTSFPGGFASSLLLEPTKEKEPRQGGPLPQRFPPPAHQHHLHGSRLTGGLSAGTGPLASSRCWREGFFIVCYNEESKPELPKDKTMTWF